MDGQTYEPLRLALISAGVSHVYGHANGSGDSADSYGWTAFTQAPQAPDAATESLYTNLIQDSAAAKDLVTNSTSYYKVTVPVLPDGLSAELNNFMDAVVEQEMWWDFNNDGSDGEFLWDLINNVLSVDGVAYYTSSEHYSNEHDMNEV